jgi:regulator of sigma E protease
LGGAPDFITVRYGLSDGLMQAVRDTWEQSSITLRMLGRMLVGEASVKNLSGVVSIADYAGQSARIGFVAYVGFLAVLSVGLAVLNLLPLPMLDGGHLMYYLFEALTGRPVPELWLGRLQRLGFVLLVLVMLLALFNDVNRLMGLP